VVEAWYGEGCLFYLLHEPLVMSSFLGNELPALPAFLVR